jgi:hypothetical protein
MSGCPDSLVRGKIAEFYETCAPELTSSPNKDVIRTYDVLYALQPMRQAICSKDRGGQYCVTETANNVNPSNLAASGPWISTAPTKKKRVDQMVLYPNTTAYSSTNLPFFFLSPDLPKEKLCVACTRSVITSYTNFESSVPYAPGLPNSPMLKNQPELYEAIRNTCGKSFMNNKVQPAGGLSSSVLQGGASRIAMGEAMGSVFLSAAALGALGLAVVL